MEITNPDWFKFYELTPAERAILHELNMEFGLNHTTESIAYKVGYDLALYEREGERFVPQNEPAKSGYFQAKADLKERQRQMREEIMEEVPSIRFEIKKKGYTTYGQLRIGDYFQSVISNEIYLRASSEAVLLRTGNLHSFVPDSMVIKLVPGKFEFTTA